MTRKKQGADGQVEQVEDIIKIVDLPKFSYKDNIDAENAELTEKMRSSATENTMRNAEKRGTSMTTKSKK